MDPTKTGGMDPPSNVWSGRTKRQDLRRVMQFCPAQPYVELEIPRDVTSISRVTFTTVSHDQGFSNEAGRLRGTYEQSYTWFDASIISPSSMERKPSRHVQRNRHAVHEPFRHEVVWDASDGNAENAAWLSSIRGGDTVQLTPRAEFPAWVNFVYEAELEVVGVRSSGESSVIAFGTEGTAGLVPYYRILDRQRQEIRLLVLEAGAVHDPVLCSLKTVSLKDGESIKYEALSYCWGATKEDRPIRVRTFPGTANEGVVDIHVTVNLYGALSDLRPKTGPPRIIWADAICINQHDLAERSHQVSLMRAVFSTAERVNIWLGPSTTDSEYCFRVVRTIAERYTQAHEHATAAKDAITGRDGEEGGGAVTEPSNRRTSEDTKQLHEPMMFQELLPFVEAWQRCDFAWFRRTWVLQEVANARVAAVQCGHDVLPWPVLVRLADCIVKSKQQTELFRYTLMPPVFSHVFEFIGSNEATSIARSAPTGILDVLVDGHALDAGDPRDKVFALLQFGRETGGNQQYLHPDILPDYRKPTWQVFTDFTRWWITTHNSLRILSTVHTERNRGWQRMSAGSPPDLAELGRPTWSFWHGGTASWAKATLALSESAPYRASGTTLPDVGLLECVSGSSAARVLCLAGVRVGTVGRIGTFPLLKSDGQPPTEDMGEMHKAFIKLFDPVGNSRTWIWPREDHKTRDRKGDNEDFWTGSGVLQIWYRDHTQAHYGYGDPVPAPAEGGGWGFPCLNPSFFSSRETVEESDSGGDGSSVKRAAYVGLCPDGAREGDVVVILYGGRVPYLLREKANVVSLAEADADSDGAEDVETDTETETDKTFYEFVGECFVDGLMHGEAMARDGFQRQEFNLV
ncbi:heterokaryon incompatibility protein-domain-containing protein [Bombardia bombarda]|uniref:Heterokaryon incompatibility protein-domain-containing protein n=1 Tax=Bombardia bombarda TaxID=252184 RepID=A0AA40CEL8_9PEZI|nr:heterokaryon incompatibility protein-domain-containing protein [Bombardia bombarda]